MAGKNVFTNSLNVQTERAWWEDIPQEQSLAWIELQKSGFSTQLHFPRRPQLTTWNPFETLPKCLKLYPPVELSPTSNRDMAFISNQVAYDRLRYSLVYKAPLAPSVLQSSSPVMGRKGVLNPSPVAYFLKPPSYLELPLSGFQPQVYLINLGLGSCQAKTDERKESWKEMWLVG